MLTKKHQANEGRSEDDVGEPGFPCRVEKECDDHQYNPNNETAVSCRNDHVDLVEPGGQCQMKGNGDQVTTQNSGGNLSEPRPG